MVHVTWISSITTLLSYALLLAMGYARDLLDRYIFRVEDEETTRPGYAPLVSSFNYFFARRMYARIRDCWDRPVSSNPGAWITVMERSKEIRMDGATLPITGPGRPCLNLGSYNYLGFADSSPYAMKSVYQALQQYGPCPSSVRSECGTTDILHKLEVMTAKFLGQESAVVFGMGFQTNSTVLPSLVGKGGLIVSDSLNHSSIVIGCKISQAKLIAFKHNDMENLENVIRTAIANGQPNTKRPWTKILIVVEGIYSMEGEILPLPEVLRIKKKYKCYLYVDEAHSIGALGSRGRGVCDHYGINPREVDILMGTFTKSFGSVGGYIAASKKIVDFVRRTSPAYSYDMALSAPCCAQIIAVMEIIDGAAGTGTIGKDKIAQLRANSNYFRRRLKEEGYTILGDDDSPVIPMMLYNPGIIGFFSRTMLAHRIAVVVVGFPATPMLLGRVRFCISAGHTIDELEKAVITIVEVTKIAGLQLIS